MQLLHLLTAIISNLAFASASEVNCDGHSCGRVDLIKECIAELYAHGDDILTVTTWDTRMVTGCVRGGGNAYAAWTGVQAMTDYGVPDGTYTVTKAQLACGAQKALDQCTVGNLVAGFADSCGEPAVQVNVAGAYNGAIWNDRRNGRRGLGQKTEV